MERRALLGVLVAMTLSVPLMTKFCLPGRLSVLVGALALVVSSCTSDNAVELSLSISSAAKALRADGDRSEATVTFVPVEEPERSYTLIFFPDRETKPSELVALGLEQTVVDDVFDTLGYVEIGTRPSLVVWRKEGEMSFTGVWNREAVLPETLVHVATGESRVKLLEQDGDVKIVSIQ